MSKYTVSTPMTVWVNVEVEADSEDEAMDLGYIKTYLTGNGGMGKLVGTSDLAVTLEIGEVNGDSEVHLHES